MNVRLTLRYEAVQAGFSRLLTKIKEETYSEDQSTFKG